jgi:hypothetical protein
MTHPYDVITAYHDNIRHNQIGGLQDGIDAQLMADLGYETPERMIEIMSGLGAAASCEAAPAALKENESPVCGDCGRPLPCQHGNGRRTFGY